MSAGARLALSASQNPLSLALRLPDGQLLRPAGASRAKDLSAATQELLRAAGLEPAELQAIHLDLGPGSYTGLRVAVTLTRFLATFCELEVHCATSLELIGLAVLAAEPELAGQCFRPLLDARRDRWHHALLHAGTRLELRSEPRAETIAELQDCVDGDETLVCDAAAANTLAAALPGRRILPLPGYDAAWLFDPRLGLRAVPPAELEPLYLMGSYAETPRSP